MRDSGTIERARVLVLFAALSLALYVFAVTALAPSDARFLSANQLASSTRRLFTLGAFTLPLGVVLAIATAATRRPALWERLGTLADALAPALILPFLPGLFARGLWKDAALEHLVLCAGLGICLEVSLRRALPLWSGVLPTGTRLFRSLPAASFRWALRAVLVAAVLFYAVRVSSLTIMNHRRLGTFSADLAEFDSLFFNALHGHPFRSPPIDGALEDYSALKVHFEILLYALLPFYALKPGPETLLVLQAGIVALTAVPLYAFASRRLGEPLGLLLSLALLLMPAVEQPNFYDYHFLPLGMLCVMTAICLADRVAEGSEPRRLWAGLFGVAFVLALLAREDIAFGLGLLGLVLWVSGRAPRAGMLVTLVAWLWFGVIRFAVMPRFGPMWFAEMYADLCPPGNVGAFGVLETLLTNPVFVLRKLSSAARLQFVLELAVPLAFLWWRRPWLLLAALPGFPFTLLVTNRDALYRTSFQYVYHWIPYIFAASVLGLETLGPRGGARRRAAAVALAFSTLAVSYHQGAFLGARFIQGGPARVPFRTTSFDRQRLERLERVIARLPSDASVAATEHEGPHVSTRLLAFTFYAARGRQPRYLLINESALTKDEYFLLRKLDPSAYGVVAREAEFYLLERGTANPEARTLLAALAERFDKKP